MTFLLKGNICGQQGFESGHEIVFWRIHAGPTTAALPGRGDYAVTGIADTDVEAIAAR